MTRLLKQFILTAMLALFASQASALFVQADNWDPRMQGVGTNRYAYAGGDPINMSDPNGHASFYIGGAYDNPEKRPNRSPIWNFGQENEIRNNDVLTSSYEPKYYRWHQVDRIRRWGDQEVRMSAAARDILNTLAENPEESINIFGHSYGGDSAVRLANELGRLGVTPSLVVTLDPVSTDRENGSNPRSMPSQETPWLNFYPNRRFNNLGNGKADIIAWAGGIWGRTPGAMNVEVTDWPGRGNRSSGHVGVIFGDVGGGQDVYDIIHLILGN